MNELNQTNMAVGEWQYGVTGTPFEDQAAVQEMDTLPVSPEQVYSIPVEPVEIAEEMPVENVADMESASEEVAEFNVEPATEETVGFVEEPVAEETITLDAETLEEETTGSVEENEEVGPAESIQSEDQPQEEDEETKRLKHETEEAERKAEWEARQQQKRMLCRNRKKNLPI